MNRRAFLGASTGFALAPALAGCAADQAPVIDTALPVSPFDAGSTAQEVTEGIDLHGRTALVTGCNSGIGLETMRVLALRGAHVIGTGRTLAKAAAACDSMSGALTPVALELTDYASVVACAQRVAEITPTLDMLVCNAGIHSGDTFATAGGVERTFVINHLGHFVLVNRLLALVLAAPQGRVVVVSSRAAWSQAPAEGIQFDKLGANSQYDGGATYGQSKLANALFSRALAARLGNSTASSNALHPGLVKTNIARNMSWITRTAFDVFGPLIAKDLAQGAATSCHVAASPLLGTVSGRFFADCNPVTVPPPHHLDNDAMAEVLWNVSEQMTQPYLTRWPV